MWCKVCSPGALTRTKHLLASVSTIRHFRSKLKHRSKLLISVGFESVTAECHFLKSTAGPSGENSGEYEAAEILDAESQCDVVVLTLEQPIHVRAGAMLLAIKLDTQKRNECRLAFHGSILKTGEKEIAELPVFRTKERRGVVERAHDPRTLICNGLFKKETDISVFNHMLVHLQGCDGSSLGVGRIDGTFGKQVTNSQYKAIVSPNRICILKGKCRISLSEDICQQVTTKLEKNQMAEVILRSKVYQNGKKIISY